MVWCPGLVTERCSKLGTTGEIQALKQTEIDSAHSILSKVNSGSDISLSS